MSHYYICGHCRAGSGQKAKHGCTDCAEHVRRSIIERLGRLNERQLKVVLAAIDGFLE